MSTIQAGDRVRWRSTKAKQNGVRTRTGTVLKIYAGTRPYAFVRPDRGDGRLQHLSLARLRLVTERERGEADGV